MNQLTRLIIVAHLFAVAGWALAQEAIDSSPRALLDGAVAELQAAESFRLEIEQTGEPYQLALTLDGVNMLPAALESAAAQVISPDELHISARIRMFIPLSLDVYARVDRQWLSFPSGAPWIPLPAFEGFDISRLLAPDDGIDWALSNLREARVVPAETALNEGDVWRIEARAPAEAVEGLLFGLIAPQDDVAIDAYIGVDDGRLLRIEILMLETVSDLGQEPSVWHIKFYDYDAPRAFEPPDG
ncbi:MAG: LppX_LprAFG lipoprotein [Chloroflexi bacterium]|nr:LppX_LprAFG lipoprotein [Chloroflexota bacterium]